MCVPPSSTEFCQGEPQFRENCPSSQPGREIKGVDKKKNKTWNHRPKTCSCLACRNLPSFPCSIGSQWAPEPIIIFRTCSGPLPGSIQVPGEQSTQHQNRLTNLCVSDEQSLLWISTSLPRKYQVGPLRGNEWTLLRSETTSTDLCQQGVSLKVLSWRQQGDSLSDVSVAYTHTHYGSDNTPPREMASLPFQVTPSSPYVILSSCPMFLILAEVNPLRKEAKNVSFSMLVFLQTLKCSTATLTSKYTGHSDHPGPFKIQCQTLIYSI